MKQLFIEEVTSKTMFFLENNQRIKLKEILIEICLNCQITIKYAIFKIQKAIKLYNLHIILLLEITKKLVNPAINWN